MPESVRTERKWLIEALIVDNFVLEAVVTQEQGYVTPPPGQKGYFRLRREETIEKTVPPRYWLTIKSAEVFNEDPPDHEISVREFKILWPWTEGRRVQKRRHVIKFDGRFFDYDIYYFEGEPDLHILETEFDSDNEAAKFILPKIFGNARDVSNDPRYKADGLASNGRPSVEDLV